MKTKMSPTSLAAYWSMRDAGELTPARQIVYNALAEHGRMTRERIADVLHIKEGSVCGRVRELIDFGLVEVVGHTINLLTTHSNTIVDLTPHRRAMHQTALELEGA